MIASRASRQYRCLRNHAVPSLLWHAEFRLRFFIYFNFLFYSRHTKLPGRKCARPRRRRQLPAPPAPVTATSQGAARPSSPPAPATASARCRRCCSLSSPFQRSLSLPSQRSPRRLRPSPQVAPATATSASALQVSKFYSGELAESISNNAQ